MCRAVLNRLMQAEPQWNQPHLAFLEQIRSKTPLVFHRSLPGYAPTPLHALPQLARRLGIGRLYVKDEAGRFGINSFKALGASYAIHSWLQHQQQTGTEEPGPVRNERRDRLGTEEREAAAAAQAGAAIPAASDDRSPSLSQLTLCAATDGNHGRAVAWTARMLGQAAVIYLPADSALARIQAIQGEGGRTILVEGSFDDCVRRCAADAAARGWQVVSDTAYPGYEDIPRRIMLGYSTMFNELETQINLEKRPFDLVLLPAGVGGLAAAGSAFFVQHYGARRPRLVCVEPLASDCFLQSALAGDMRATSGNQDSIMAGLNCGEPSLVAWPIVRDAMHLFLAIADHYAEQAMRLLAEYGITAGESGAAALAGLLALLQSDHLADMRDQFLGPETRVLVLNTEGATDPEGYARVIDSSP